MGGSSVIIEELTGEKRTIKLVGSGQPFRPATIATMQKVVTSWYPGNPEADQQVLGPQEPPSEWEGEWRRNLLGRTPAVVTDASGTHDVPFPMALVELFDDVVKQGRRIRVTWAAIDGTNSERGRIVREGRLESVEWKIDRADIIGWKMKFAWAGRIGTVRAVSVPNEGSLISYFSAMQQSANALALANAVNKSKQSNAAIPNSATYFSLGQFESMLDAPKRLVDEFDKSVRRFNRQIDQLSNIVKKTVTLPANVARSAVGIAKGLEKAAVHFRDKISAFPAELQAAKPNPVAVLRAFKFGAQTADLSNDTSERARELAEKWSPAVRIGTPTKPSDVLGIHIVRRGETLQSIAMQWYQDPSLSTEICKANKLPWNQVIPPRPTLVIPAIKTLTQATTV